MKKNIQQRLQWHAALIVCGLMITFSHETRADQASGIDTKAVLGGAIGGGTGAAIGSAVGGRNGAILGSAVGAAAGVVIATPDGHETHDSGHHHGHKRHHHHRGEKKDHD